MNVMLEGPLKTRVLSSLAVCMAQRGAAWGLLGRENVLEMKTSAQGYPADPQLNERKGSGFQQPL